MNILHVFSVCLTALCGVKSAVTKVGVVGGTVEIKCFISGTGTNIKYFCKKPCSVHKDVLIQTKINQDYVMKGRYSIHDIRNGVFNVKVKNLTKSDSGTYWCGVETYGPDKHQEVYITVTDAHTIPKSSTINHRLHVTTTLQTHSTTSPNMSTSLLNMSATSSSTFSVPSSARAGRTVWTSVCLVVIVTTGLALILFYGRMKATRRPLPQPVFNINPTPGSETDCVYEEIIEADIHTLSVVSASIYYTIDSPTTYPAGVASANYPANRAKADLRCDLNANASCSNDDADQSFSSVDFQKDQINPIYSTADHLASFVYSGSELHKDSIISSVTLVASGTLEDSNPR